MPHRARSRCLRACAGNLQLADFGFSKDARQQSEAKTRVGTPAYLAPEVLQAQPGRTYDAQVSASDGEFLCYGWVLSLGCGALPWLLALSLGC